MARKKRANYRKQHSEATADLPQRIGESASGLVKESFKRPSPKDITGVLASLNTENAKAGSSSSSTSTSEPSMAFRSSSHYEQVTSDHGEPLCLNRKDGKISRFHGQVTFDEFLAGPNEFGHESGFAQDGHALSTDQQSGFSLGVARENSPRVQEGETWKTQGENEDFADHNNDGAAVVALLSDLAFAVDEEPSSILDSGSDRGERRNYERLETGKGPAERSDTLRPPISLDLVPDFGAPWNLGHASLVTEKGIQQRGHFLESRFGDIQPWIDILDRYHNEVWGDMLPEARKELKAANESQTCHQDGPAIRRLRMVLQHLGNPNNG
ncbi:MAG: hypothetical protein ASARMPREDX12_008092 [Alectoria sarmentosa]|nr:MAG: hypothetical protein ASARMPREDX12_008092 [Alectoria sarmentosa]CAD6594298.1 MAG: hypothetical protein ASARMPRED_009050 [Alectoria sarmentosa]